MIKTRANRRFARGFSAAALALAALLMAVASPWDSGSAVAAEPPDGWSVYMEAEMPGVVDKGQITIGAGTGALEGLDPFDTPHPPAFSSDYIDLYTSHEQTETGWESQPVQSLNYMEEFFPPLDGSDLSIDFSLETDQSGDVALSWVGIDDAMLEAYQVVLEDVDAGFMVDLRVDPAYVFSAVPGVHQFRLHVLFGLPLTARFSAEPTPGVVNEPVQFTDTSISSTRTGSPITGWAWDFGDGATSTDQNPSHTFVSAGTYPVTLTVTDDEGETASITRNFAVVIHPVAAFSTSPEQPFAGDPVQFTDESTDSDGTVVAWDWDFGDGETSSQQNPVHTYSSPGTYSVVLTVVDDDGAEDTTALEVDIFSPPEAAFDIDRGLNVAALDNGATIADFSGVYSTSSSYQPINAIDHNTSSRWRAGSGDTEDQWIKVDLSGDRTWIVDTVRLRGTSSTTGARDFELRLSTTGTDDTDFAVAHTGTIPQNTSVHEFTFPPAAAKHAQLVLLNNHGHSNVLELYHFELHTRDRQGGIVSLLEGGGGATITGVTSELNASYLAPNAIDGNTGSMWRSASGSPTDQWIKVELAHGAVHTIDRIRLRSSSSSEAIRDFEVRVSTTTDEDSAFTTVFMGTGAQTTSTQSFDLPSATQARFVQLVALNNNGSSCCVRVNDFEVLDQDGANVAPREGLAAVVLDRSSQWNSTSLSAENAIDYSTSSNWRTASGEVTDQWVKVRLTNGAPFQIDRVQLFPPNSTAAPRNFEFRVSDTGFEDGDFTTVVAGTLPRDGRGHWFTFPAVEAKYVQLFFADNHGYSNYMYLSGLRVFAQDIGAATVPFSDASIDLDDSSLAAWAWEFGDGATSTEQHPEHTYAVPGDYTITLTVTDNDGIESSATRDYRVVAAPSADFSWTPLEPEEAERTNFSDLSSAPDGRILSWSWDFDNGRSSSSRNPNTTYNDNGTYNPALSVLDSNFLRGDVSKQITVTNVPPTANAGSDRGMVWGQSWSPASSVSDPSSVDRGSLVCDWDFGDGNTHQVTSCNSNNSRVGHSYDAPGTYTVELVVTDKDGASATDTLVATAGKREVMLHIVNAGTVAGGTIEFDLKLYDRFNWSLLPNAPVVLNYGTQTVNLTTDSDGEASGSFTAEPGVDDMTATYAGNSFYHSFSIDRAVNAPKGDIVFVIDTSGSMGDDIDEVRANVADMAAHLSAQVDFRFGLVDGEGNPPNIVRTLTGDLPTMVGGLDELRISGGYEPGLWATTVGMSDEMGFRAGAGTCLVLIADEDSDVRSGSTAAQDRIDALDAMRARNGVWFGIINPNAGTSRVDYGPDPASISEQTGGSVFNILDFRQDSDPVLDAILTQCIQRILTPDLEITKTNDMDTVAAGDTVTYDLTVTAIGSGNATGVVISDTLPEHTTFVSASDGATELDGVVTWPAIDLLSGESVTRTVTVQVDATVPAGVETLTNTASVTDDGSHGADPTPANNTATDTDDLDAAPDLAIIKAADENPVIPGSALVYTLTVTNQGTRDAADVVLVDQLPDSVLYDSATASQGTCAEAAGTVTCQLGGLDVGASASVIINVTVNSGVVEDIVNTASVESDHADLDATNNTFTEITGVTDVGGVNTPPVADAGGPYTVDEGGSVTLDGSGSSDEDQDADTLIYEWDLDGDGIFDATGVAPTFDAALLDGPSNVMVSLRVTDDEGESSTSEADVEVLNVAPTVTATGGEVTEGQSVTISGTIADPGVDDSFTVVFDWHDGTSDTFTYAAGTTSFSETHVYADDDPSGTVSDVYSVNITVTDDDGGEGTTSADVIVNNAPPVVDAGGGAEIDENTEFTSSGSFGDPGEDQWTATVDYGDGTGVQSLALNADKTFDLSHIYADDGVFTVTVTVGDDDGGEGSDTVVVTVHNLPPSADAGGPYTVDEGSSVTLTGTGSDPAGIEDPLTFEWDLDGDGTFETVGESVNFDASLMDGPQTVTASLRVSDDDNGVTVDTATIEVLNVAPSITASGDSIHEGESATVSGIIVDPGVADVFTVVIEWGDGSSGTFFYPAGSTSYSESHVYADDSPSGTPVDDYLVNVTVADDDGGQSDATTTVTVANIAPVITDINLASAEIDEGGEAILNVAFEDPGLLDTHEVSINWGDGFVQTLTLPVGERSFTASRGYADDDPPGTLSDDYTISVTITDDDTGTDSAETTLTVLNVAPSVTVAGDTINEGGTATVAVTFTDAGALDVHTATVDWGDGTPVEDLGTVTSPFVLSHVYGDDGAYTVAATVIDDDTGEGTATGVITVVNLDPSVALDASGAINFDGGAAFYGRKDEGQSHTASASDAGSDDLVFAWDGAGSTTYFNDGVDSDPVLSPYGNFPFAAENTVGLTFGSPGLHTVMVVVTDDDGGSAEQSFTKIIVDNSDCTRSQGFWGHQFSGRGRAHIDDPALEQYLALINFASGVFSESIEASTLDEANAVLLAPGLEANARSQLLAAWLNFAWGAIGWDELVDTDGDGSPDTPFSILIWEAEAIIGDPDASDSSLEHAKDLTEAVNLHDQDNPSCEDDGGRDGADHDDEDEGQGPGGGPPANVSRRGR